MHDDNGFPASVLEYDDHFITVLPIAKFDDFGKEPVLTSSYRAFIYRKKFESVGPPGMGREPKRATYDYPDWKIAPVVDNNLTSIEFATAREAFAKAKELVDWFHGKV
jgi:hypothetical protein